MQSLIFVSFFSHSSSNNLNWSPYSVASLSIHMSISSIISSGDKTPSSSSSHKLNNSSTSSQAKSALSGDSQRVKSGPSKTPLRLASKYGKASYFNFFASLHQLFSHQKKHKYLHPNNSQKFRPLSESLRTFGVTRYHPNLKFHFYQFFL